MRIPRRSSLLVPMLALLAAGESSAKRKEFTDSFMLETCRFAARGTNPYFILTPGYRLILESEPSRRRKDEHVVLVVTVLDETEEVAGVTTRVVEERETADGRLVEISRNFFALCEQNNSVVYFGEDVDNYDETGTTVVNHDGGWRAGVNGARPGVLVPGLALVGARYYQEIAPDVALDRAEIVSVSEVVTTPSGTFQGCLKTKETTPLERRSKSFKSYAPGIGLIRDDDLVLTSFGSAN